MKFLYYSISFGCFLILLTMVTFESYREETGEIKGGGKTRWVFKPSILGFIYFIKGIPIIPLIELFTYNIQFRASDRGPPPTLIEYFVLIWVLGMLWSEVKQLVNISCLLGNFKEIFQWEEGFHKYVYQWWNWLDFIMICLYLCTISLRYPIKDKHLYGDF